MQITDFPAVVCPSCAHSFPIRKIGKDRIGLCSGRCDVELLKTKLPFGSPVYLNEKELPLQQNQDVVDRAKVMKMMAPDDSDGAKSEMSYTESDPEPPGQLGTGALSILMGVLYCARMARFDLLRITCKCATRVTKWTMSDDKRVLRLMRYIQNSYELRLVGFFGDPVTDINVSLFTDADFAGDVISQRSTSGIHLALNGRYTYYPLHALSAKQTAVSYSTPEAELIAASRGHLKVTLPSLDLWETIAPAMAVPRHHEDNQAMIMSVMSGRNPSMRHIGRTHGIDVQGLHDRLGPHPGRDNVTLFYESTHNMSADIYIYTKAFKDLAAWSHALQLINMFRA